jgi:hypothetical protein
MRLVGRLLLAAAACAIALQPMNALASLPVPNPALSSVLAPPPSKDYVESARDVPGIFEGQFDAKTFVAITGSTKADAMQKTLERDGFVDGYGRTWVQKGTQRVLVEYVMAFAANDGAKKWLRAAQAADKSDPGYQRSISITGIDTYYGAHFFFLKSQSYGDGFAFVKGNDFFTVVFVSPQDDLGNAAADQTMIQFNVAPDYTIPHSQGASTKDSFAYNFGMVLGPVILAVFLLVIILFAVAMVRRRQRHPAVAAGALQLSEDGRYWWDGQVWRDSGHEVPPTAQRSADGSLWWDGRTWRPMPPPPS